MGKGVCNTALACAIQGEGWCLNIKLSTYINTWYFLPWSNEILWNVTAKRGSKVIEASSPLHWSEFPAKRWIFNITSSLNFCRLCTCFCIYLTILNSLNPTLVLNVYNSHRQFRSVFSQLKWWIPSLWYVFQCTQTCVILSLSVSICLPSFYASLPSEAIRKHLLHSDVCCYFTWRPKKSQEETAAESQRSHCSSSLIVFSSISMVNLTDGWLTCSFHWSCLFGSSPTDRIHSSSFQWEEGMETENTGGSLSLQTLPQCSI